MKNLSAFERDLITDLAQDTHGMWEVFGFVRAHFPHASNQEVLRIGRATLASWLAHGWLTLAEQPLYPSSLSSLSQVLPLLDSQGEGATKYFPDAPSFDLSDTAYMELGLQAFRPRPRSTLA